MTTTINQIRTSERRELATAEIFLRERHSIMSGKYIRCKGTSYAKP